MTDGTLNRSERAATERDRSLDETPKTISKGTIIMLVATILFIIIASVLIAVFLNMPTGGESGSILFETELRANL